MPDSIISVAVMEPLDGLEENFLRVLAELYTLMESKGYSQDTLLRNRKYPPHYIHIRHWSSLSARREAQEDPAVQRCWARLGNLCRMVRVHDVLDEVDWKAIPPKG
jgi:quinol monooxygenase YgiN